MGIIKRQAYSGTVLSYLGVIIGYITTAVLFPGYLTTAEIGLIGVFLSYAYIFAQLASLGLNRITIVFFPYFRDRNKDHHGFFPLMAMIAVIGLVIALTVLLLLKSTLISNSHDESTLFSRYFNYLFPLIIATLLFQVMDSFNTTLFNAIRGIFLKEFLQRLLVMIAIIFFILKWVEFDRFIMLWVIALALPGIVLMYYVVKNKEFRFKPADSPLIREKSRLMAEIGLNGIFIGFSGMIILYVDRIMVERLMGLASTGIYTTMSYFATLIAIPSRALLKISDPVIAQSWKDNNIASIRDNYYRSSLNQFLIGRLLMIGIWGNIGNIVRMLPPAFEEGRLVILFVGLAFLVDMLTGTATFILANSKYFKYQTYYILLLVVLIVVTNYFLIPIWGLTGAAVATLLSKLITNFIRYLILYRKFGLQPYNYKFAVIIIVSFIAYLAQYFMPDFKNLYFDIIIRSSIMSIVFLSLALGLKISPEVNERIIALKKKLSG